MPFIVQNDFNIHHAKPDYIMLYKWICKDEDDVVPQYAFHTIGVGGLVINDKGEVLVIQEKYKAGNIAMWKLPGGLAEPGEDIATVAIREVYEETGVEATFDSILAFRHMHQYAHGCSDIYFVCLLAARDTDTSNVININNREIDKCQWMMVEDYMSSEGISAANRYFAQVYTRKYGERGQGSQGPQACSCERDMRLRGERVENFTRTGHHLIYTVHTPGADHSSSTHHTAAATSSM